MLYNIDSLDAGKQRKYPGRMGRFAENVKRAVRNTLAAAGIATSSVSPMATTSTFIPATVNTITAVAPTVASTAAKTIALGTAASLLTACGEDEPEIKDTTPPTINVSHSEVDITGGKEVYINGNQLYIGNTPVASRYDNKTKNCGVALYMNGKNITSGTIVSEEGTLTIRVIDDDGNVRTVDIKLNIAKNAPSITVNQYEVNVFGGEVVSINNNQLLLGDEVIAIRNDDNLESCKVSLSFNGQAIKSGDTISEAGTLTITITNKNSKTSTAEITVTNDAIYGLENLRNAILQVDKEINLLNGISFADGVELVKTEVEADGKRTTVDPNHYTPSYPGTINVIFTIKGKNGNTDEVKVDSLNIKPLDYQEASIDNANMIQEKYPRYNNLQQTTKDFIYPHLIASYAACNRSKQDNRVHIIQGETTNASDVENIGQGNDRSDHAYQGYYRIRALSPDVSIKGCDDYRNNLEEYINHHPDKIYIISCAAGSAGGRDREEYNRNPETSPQKSLLENENVIIICSGGNWRQAGRKTYNESIKNGDYYTASATNSKKNNKITVTGYNSWESDNYFSPNYSVYGGLRSAMPIGYNKDKGNILMPMVPLISSYNNEDQNSTSSYPTAVTSSVIGNAISVIMANHPGITAEDAMTIIVNNYLKKEKFQYKDETTNRELVDGDYRYFVDIQKLLKTELLQSDKIDGIKFNSDLVELPSSNGICYTGKGIQFEYNGKRYNITSENQSIINQVLKSGNIKWYWNKDLFKKYGGKNSANFDAYVIDKNGKKIPNLHLAITKSVI